MNFKISFSGIDFQFNSIALLLVCSFMVSACGGSKTVVTQDDSAEYRSAKTLPPLRKPGRAPIATTTANIETQRQAPAAEGSLSQGAEGSLSQGAEGSLSQGAEGSLSQGAEGSLSQGAEGSLSQGAEGSLEQVAEGSLEQVAENNVIAAQVVDQVSAEPVQPSKSSVISASVLEADDTARLRIDASLDQAWSYLSSNLQKSDITVHNRNRAAGRFSIGCASIDDSDSNKKTSGGWSIFRRKAESSEHCSLHVQENKSDTLVSVINRSGLEVVAADAKQIFSRLLNN